MPASRADFVYYNARVVTMAPGTPSARAFAVKEGKFLAVGDNREVLQQAGPQTVKIDLQGKCVVPGLNDGHCHPFCACTTELDAEIPIVKTVEDVLRWFAARAAQKPKGEWIVLFRIFPIRLKELRYPTLAELDAVTPHHPAFINGTFGGMVNSCAFKMSGIDSRTTHAGVLKDKDGMPSGFLQLSAFPLLHCTLCPEVPHVEHRSALKRMLSLYNRAGITSITETMDSEKTWPIYQALKDSGELTVRVCLNYCLDMQPQDAKAVQKLVSAAPAGFGQGDDWVRMGPFKVFVDGGILTGTAFLHKPWGPQGMRSFNLKSADFRGVVNYRLDNLFAVVGAAQRMGWPFTAHVTGDASLGLLLQAYHRLHQSSPLSGSGYTAIHANFMDKHDMALAAEMGIFIEIQPVWLWKDAHAVAEILGPDYLAKFHPYRSMLQSGLTLCGGSDHMAKFDPELSINPYNPFIGMYAMTTRRDEQGRNYGEAESITREQALAAYTINNAKKTGEEKIKGSIEPAKLADFAVLDRNLLTCADQELLKINVETTVVGGSIVYQRGA